RDRRSGLRMLADFARQAQQLQCPVEIEVGQILRDGGALCVLAVAQLDVGAEAPHAASDFHSRFGIGADRAVFLGAFFSRLAELSAEAALGIVRTGDERSEAPAAQREAAMLATFGDALGASARITSIGLRRKQIVRQEL